MNIIYDNTFNLHNCLFNYENKNIKVNLKSKLIRVPRYVISGDYHEF